MAIIKFYSPDNVAGILMVPHAIFSVLATIFVGLRFYTRRHIAHQPWAADDTIVLIALVANHAMLISEGAAVPYGFGTDLASIMTDTTSYPYGITAFLKCILVIECFYGVAAPTSKLAVLALYYRIFNASPLLRHFAWAISAGLVGWGVAVVLVSIFSCDPVRGFWEPTIPRTCIDSSKFYIGITVPNIVFDLLTVVLPVVEVWKLQMGKDKKLAITGVFLLGGSVVLASIVRLILFIVYRPGEGADGNNISQSVIIPHTASAIECPLAIIGACLPPSAPLFRRVLGGVLMSTRRGYGKYGSSGGKNSKGTSGSEGDAGKRGNTLVTIGKISARKGARRGADEDDDSSGFERLDDLQGSTDAFCMDGAEKGNTVPQRSSSHIIKVNSAYSVERGGEVTQADLDDRIVGDIEIPLKSLKRMPSQDWTRTEVKGM